MRCAGIDIIHMMLAFGILNRDTQGLSVGIFECHNTVQDVSAVMRIYTGCNYTEIGDLTTWRAVSCNSNLNKTLFALIRCGEEIIGVAIRGAYCFVQTAGSIKSPMTICVVEFYPFVSNPFKPGTSLVVIISFGRTFKAWLQRERVSYGLCTYFYYLSIRISDFRYRWRGRIGRRTIEIAITPMPHVVTMRIFIFELTEIVQIILIIRNLNVRSLVDF